MLARWPFSTADRARCQQFMHFNPIAAVAACCRSCLTHPTPSSQQTQQLLQSTQQLPAGETRCLAVCQAREQPQALQPHAAAAATAEMVCRLVHPATGSPSQDLAAQPPTRACSRLLRYLFISCHIIAAGSYALYMIVDEACSSNLLLVQASRPTIANVSQAPHR
jgi:hypothetical protein